MNLHECKIGDCVRHVDYSVSQEYETKQPFSLILTIRYGRIVALHEPFFNLKPHAPKPGDDPNTFIADMTVAEAAITIEDLAGQFAILPVAGAEKISILELLALASAAPEELK